MSTKNTSGSLYDNRQLAEELHDGPGHKHRVAEQQGKQEHLSGHEHSRQALEHSVGDHQDAPMTGGRHGVTAFGHKEIAALAYELWQGRGCPDGSSETDWFCAAEKLRAQSFSAVRD